MKKPKWILAVALFVVALLHVVRCFVSESVQNSSGGIGSAGDAEIGFAGIAYASTKATTGATTGYICPVTGEVLPSPECCPYCK